MNREIFAPQRHGHRYTLARVAAVIAMSLVPLQFSFGQKSPDLDPVAFMFKRPLHDDAVAGGFYSVTLADGTNFNANLFFRSGANRAPGRLQTGAVWSSSEFDGRVVAIEIQPAPAGSFSFKVSVGAANTPEGDSQQWWRAGAVSPGSPASGFGVFQRAPQAMDASFSGQWSPDFEHAQGLWVDQISHKQQTFSMQRLFKYRRIEKRWPYFEDVKPAFAQFVASFPILPYDNVQAQVIKESANCPADGRCENEVTVVAFSEGKLTLRNWQFDKSEGGSGEYGVSYSTYEIKGKRATPLRLDQVMSVSGDCSKRLGPIVASRLSGLLEQAQPGSELPVSISADPLRSSDGFIASSRGITLHYQPLSLNTSFASGEFFVTLTSTELAGCVSH